MDMAKKKKLLKIRDAANLLGVNPETLRRWDREGSFRAIRIGKRGHRMYDESDTLKLLEKKKNRNEK